MPCGRSKCCGRVRRACSSFAYLQVNAFPKRPGANFIPLTPLAFIPRARDLLFSFFFASSMSSWLCVVARGLLPLMAPSCRPITMAYVAPLCKPPGS